jgi:glutamate-1-semialdehyde 2,1-aminomutase
MATPTPYEIRWAQAIKRLVPSIERVRFTASGATASLLAARVARAYTGRTKIAKFAGHYHSWQGDVAADAGTLSTTAGVPRSHLNTVVVMEPDLVSLSAWLSSNRDTTAAVMVDPLGAGVGETDEDKRAFLHTLRELTAQRDVLLILDEAISGFRLSKGGAQVRYEVEPDLTIMAKIVAGGLPGGAVGGKATIMDLVGNDGDPHHIAHASTGNGNPLSAVAGATTLEIIEREPINKQADATAEHLNRELNTVCRHLQLAGQFQSMSSMVEPRFEEGEPNAFRMAMAVHGVRGWGFLVSAAHEETHIDRTVEAFEKSVRSMRTEGLLR